MEERLIQKAKRRITQLVKEGRHCFLFQLDAIVIYWGKLKRYILTAVDYGRKLGYTRIYKHPHQFLAYLTPVEYIERELAKIHSPVLPMYLS